MVEIVVGHKKKRRNVEATKMLLMSVSVAVVIAIIGGLSWLAINGGRTLSERGRKSLDELIASLGVQGQEQPELTKVVFPVYVGTVFYVVELQAEFYIEKRLTRKAINSLAGFSLKYGLLTGFAPYVLFMVLLNYILNVPKLIRA